MRINYWSILLFSMEKYKNGEVFLKKMTLVIGFKYKEGVVIISDRKVMDSDNNITWEEKINYKTFRKRNTIFSSAGYSHLFNRFNRKIFNKVEENIKKIDLENYKALKEAGLEDTYKSIEEETEKPKKIKSNFGIEELKKQIKKQISTIVSPPYSYTTDNFIDDCRSLVKELCKEQLDDEYKLDVLLALFNGEEPTLHLIDFTGEEEEITDYRAIGSGAIYIEHLLKRFYKPNRPIEYLIKLGYFCILFVQNLELDNFVGVEEGTLPDNSFISNEGGLFTYEFNDKPDLLKELNVYVKRFQDDIDSLTF